MLTSTSCFTSPVQFGQLCPFVTVGCSHAPLGFVRVCVPSPLQYSTTSSWSDLNDKSSLFSLSCINSSNDLSFFTLSYSSNVFIYDSNDTTFDVFAIAFLSVHLSGVSVDELIVEYLLSM